MEFNHKPVLLKECLEGLNIKSDGIYVDATLGGAGHSYHILEKLSTAGHLYGFDQDVAAIEASKLRLSSLSLSNYTLVHANFSKIRQVLDEYQINNIDGALFDLGVSSFQLDSGERGFSYNFNATLDMRMDQRQSFTAYDIVNTYSEKQIADILYLYGEEKFSRQIARNIISKRVKAPIRTTFELVDIIKESLPAKSRNEKGHPAKRTFQALRIEVNQELTILRQALLDVASRLNPQGRLCVITFHSLEDRIVKDLFKELSSEQEWNRNMPISLKKSNIQYRLLHKKPLISSDEELIDNRRAASAKLRIIEKI